MNLETFEQPRAGRTFRYILSDGVELMRSRAFVNGQLIYTNDCPDPPCHEEFIVPANAGGGTLRIIGEDTSGRTIDRIFNILDERSSGGFSAVGG
ncbi:hypothetical protein HFO42_25920 [Rhizobium leguminosarum]|uniref:Uncharacterized protein n=1 Tax=Rhizobium leguminosarum TaxID=384 RepID=A0AAJ1AD80_RHILE|nr:hypothetical protein [Rhizobium leguminosarum]MBY5536595.1 hypothetical protein [Rhizobium leguminosarum]MBY5597957.1 hypothetical protein [Rhizobium leguminosarum]MBY5617951.1 hypothetical protein [Rhizobium leguminosarum]MBY5631497.1 hypothetical protein [Rhizobium leguminosarum]